MRETNRTIAFTGGGTAGHVFPAFPVVERMRSAGFNVVWIGSRRGMERKLVEDSGCRYHGIPAGKFRRYFSLRNAADLFRIAAGFLAALKIFLREKPCAVFSKGGFVSVPPVAAARCLRIPALTHESDVDPGLATRLNLRLGARALASYERTLSYLPAGARERAVVTGNPVRDTFFDPRQADREEGRRIAGLGPEDKRPLIVVIGGSQGAREVNDLIFGTLDSLLGTAAVAHQTGEGNPIVSDRDGYLSRPFFSRELPHLLAAADLAVGRSGAGSVWEFAATGTPAVFVPLRGGATRGDQILNAELAEGSGMAVVLPEGSGPEDLGRLIRDLFAAPERLAAMKAAAAAYPAREAADRIARVLEECAR